MQKNSRKIPALVALYRAMRLRFGYGFESCDANGPRNVKDTNLAKHRPVFLYPLLLVGSKELVLEVPKPRAISCCDSCDNLTLRFVCQRKLGRGTVSRRNFCGCGSASEALRRNMPLRFPPNFPGDFQLQKSKRNSPTSFCRCAGRYSFPSKTRRK